MKIMFNDFLTILIFPAFSSFSLVVFLLNRYNMEHVRPAETSVKPIYIRTSTLLIATGNITTLPCFYNSCSNDIMSLLLETFLLVRLNSDQSKPMKISNT